MRQFVCLGHDVPLDGDFSLDDLAGGAGRLDAICRSVTAALLRSHGIREDVRVHLVLGDELTIQIDGATVRRLNPDERSTAARIRDALAHREEAIGAIPAEPSPGFSLYRRGLADTLDALDDGVGGPEKGVGGTGMGDGERDGGVEGRDGVEEGRDEGVEIIHLHEEGEPLVDRPLPASPVFVLSDHHEFTEREASIIADRADRSVRLGPVALHADQAITVAHHALDTNGYEAF